MEDLVKVVGLLTGELAVTNALLLAMVEEMPTDARKRVKERAMELSKSEGLRLSGSVTGQD